MIYVVNDCLQRLDVFCTLNHGKRTSPHKVMLTRATTGWGWRITGENQVFTWQSACYAITMTTTYPLTAGNTPNGNANDSNISNNCNGIDYYAASYAPQWWLQQYESQHEKVFVEALHSVPSFCCTCTKPGLKSNDNSWVGEMTGMDQLIMNTRVLILQLP